MQFLQPRYLYEPPAWFYSRVLVGAGEMLTPSFFRKHSITHVINCAFPADSPAWFRKAYPDRYVCLNAADSVDVNILDWYPAFEEALSRFLREGNGTIFVHCQCGINRSAFLALTYIVQKFGMPYEKSLVSLKRQRPCMFTNSVFRKQTEEFTNGRVQNSQDPGPRSERIVDGDSGLSSSGTGPGFAGFGC
jgi:protein-tyrosine phosphatase